MGKPPKDVPRNLEVQPGKCNHYNDLRQVESGTEAASAAEVHRRLAEAQDHAGGAQASSRFAAPVLQGVGRETVGRTPASVEQAAAGRAPTAPKIERTAPLVGPGSRQRLLTVAEAATHLNVCAATVYKLVREGGLPHVRVSRSIRIRLEDLADQE